MIAGGEKVAITSVFNNRAVAYRLCERMELAKTDRSLDQLDRNAEGKRQADIVDDRTTGRHAPANGESAPMQTLPHSQVGASTRSRECKVVESRQSGYTSVPP